jgi:hypothetical protein
MPANFLRLRAWPAQTSAPAVRIALTAACKAPMPSCFRSASAGLPLSADQEPFVARKAIVLPEAARTCRRDSPSTSRRPSGSEGKWIRIRARNEAQRCLISGHRPSCLACFYSSEFAPINTQIGVSRKSLKKIDLQKSFAQRVLTGSRRGRNFSEFSVAEGRRSGPEPDRTETGTAIMARSRKAQGVAQRSLFFFR